MEESFIVAVMQRLAAAGAGSDAAVGSSGLRPPDGFSAGLGLGSSSGQARAGLPARLAADEAKLVDIELSRLKLIHAQASRLLSKRLPALS